MPAIAARTAYNPKMPRIFLGNFDFEHELAGLRSEQTVLDVMSRAPGSGRPPQADRNWVWTAIAEADDVVVTNEPINKADLAPLARVGMQIPRFCPPGEQLPRGREWQAVPWGWTQSLVEVAEAYGWTCTAPPIDVVRHVNSREFRFGLERDGNIGLDGATLARTTGELEAAIGASGDNPRGWLLKANFGMSGREALRGRGRKLEGNIRNWAEKRLASTGPIVFEPIVERVAEAGIQIEIPPAGAPELIGITPLLVDSSGVYRGSRFGCPAEEIAEWQPAVEVALRTAGELQRLGYFGPLGIDAMQYRDAAGKLRLRPLQDLNARYTMGRLALGFCRALWWRTGSGGAAESRNIFTSPPLASPYEGGEKSSADFATVTGFRPPVEHSHCCGSWLHFGERHLGGRTLQEWLESVQTVLPQEVFAVPASPGSTKAPPHGAVLVLALSPDARNRTEALLFGELGISVPGAGG